MKFNVSYLICIAMYAMHNTSCGQPAIALTKKERDLEVRIKWLSKNNPRYWTRRYTELKKGILELQAEGTPEVIVNGLLKKLDYRIKGDPENTP